MSDEFNIIKSKSEPIEKHIRGSHGKYFSTVYFYDKHDNSINACCSSQVGCPESCIFCATGDAKFIRNLSEQEIREQFLQAVDSLDNLKEKTQSSLLYLIMEGMGEPTYNLEGIFQAINNSISALTHHFSTIKLRISTAGNVGAIDEIERLICQNDFPNLHHQFQVSLHSSMDDDRQILIPNFGTRYSVEDTVEAFGRLADRLNQKLKLNYMLLNFRGRNNYTAKHLGKLVKLLAGKNVKIKLTSYSDTGKDISSPPEEVFTDVIGYLRGNGLDVKRRYLLGDDIFAACGMLHYT